jgi:hypothetical protein
MEMGLGIGLGLESEEVAYDKMKRDDGLLPCDFVRRILHKRATIYQENEDSSG